MSVASYPGPRPAGRGAVVTGAAAGIGAACADPLASQGAAVVLTDIAEGGEDVADERRRSVEGTAARRFGTPEEVAAAIVFLSPHDASYITGANLVVDGGCSVLNAAA